MPRIVVYAEGATELLGSVTQLPPVGAPMSEHTLGAAHLLVRRVLCDAGVDAAAIRFDSPNRFRGRTARGSDLVKRTTVLELLTWTHTHQQPDLAVLLVDRDGNTHRLHHLRDWAQQRPVLGVVGVPIEEFEAWLGADEKCLREVFGTDRLEGWTSHMEQLERRQAKALLAAWLAHAAPRGRHGQLRRALAERCSLELLRKRCRSFAEFSNDLARAAADATGPAR